MFFWDENTFVSYHASNHELVCIHVLRFHCSFGSFKLYCVLDTNCRAGTKVSQLNKLYVGIYDALVSTVSPTINISLHTTRGCEAILAVFRNLGAVMVRRSVCGPLRTRCIGMQRLPTFDTEEASPVLSPLDAFICASRLRKDAD